MSVLALYVALSSLNLPLRQRYGLSPRIRPFQGPLYTVIGPFNPRGPPIGGFGGGLRRLCKRHRVWCFSGTMVTCTATGCQRNSSTLSIKCKCVKTFSLIFSLRTLSVILPSSCVSGLALSGPRINTLTIRSPRNSLPPGISV